MLYFNIVKTLTLQKSVTDLMEAMEFAKSSLWEPARGRESPKAKVTPLSELSTLEEASRFLAVPIIAGTAEMNSDAVAYEVKESNVSVEMTEERTGNDVCTTSIISHSHFPVAATQRTKSGQQIRKDGNCMLKEEQLDVLKLPISEAQNSGNECLSAEVMRKIGQTDEVVKQKFKSSESISDQEELPASGNLLHAHHGTVGNTCSDDSKDHNERDIDLVTTSISTATTTGEVSPESPQSSLPENERGSISEERE